MIREDHWIDSNEQILVKVATTIVRRNSTEEANGFVRIAMNHELVGPKSRLKSF